MKGLQHRTIAALDLALNLEWKRVQVQAGGCGPGWVHSAFWDALEDAGQCQLLISLHVDSSPTLRYRGGSPETSGGALESLKNI